MLDVKRLALACALLLGCDSGPAVTNDGGPPQCDGGCATTIADYCQASACPASPAQAIAEICDGGNNVKVYGGCGHTTVITYGTDTSQEIFFDSDGGLLAIYESAMLGTCCVAGPPGFQAPSLQGCTLETTSCAMDAGADADASVTDAADAGAAD